MQNTHTYMLHTHNCNSSNGVGTSVPTIAAALHCMLNNGIRFKNK